MSDNPHIQKAQAHWEDFTGMSAAMQGQIFSAEVMGRVWHKKSGLSKEEFRAALDGTAIRSHTYREY